MYLTYLALAVAAAVAPSAPVGDTLPVHIELDAPEGCSSADAFFGTLRSRTDRVRRADINELHTTLQVRLTRSRGQVVGELRIVDERGGTDSRKVQGASCGDVVQALSLTAALALDPSALVSAPATAPIDGPTTAEAPGNAPATTSAASAAATDLVPPAAPQARASNEPSGEKATEIATAPSPQARRPVPAVEIALGPVALAVLSASLSTGASLGARANLGNDGILRTSVGIAIGYARNDVVQSSPAAQAGLAMLAASVCPLRLTASVLTVQPCAILIGGWLSATSRDASHKSTADRLWSSAGGSLRTAVYLGGRLSLELEAGISAPLYKRRFFVTESRNVVAETPTFSPFVGLSLTYGMPSF